MKPWECPGCGASHWKPNQRHCTVTCPMQWSRDLRLHTVLIHLSFEYKGLLDPCLNPFCGNPGYAGVIRIVIEGTPAECAEQETRLQAIARAHNLFVHGGYSSFNHGKVRSHLNDEMVDGITHQHGCFDLQCPTCRRARTFDGARSLYRLGDTRAALIAAF